MQLLSKKIGDFKTQSHHLSSENHICEFFSTSEARIRSLCNFIVPGIIKDEAVVVIATYENLQLLKNSLILYAIDSDEVIEKGQLVLLDAEKTIQKFLTSNYIDELKFFQLVSPMLARLQAQFGGIRAYGEMVDVLYQMGRLDLTLELEQLWGEVSLMHPFSLMCGYTADSFLGKNNHLKQICKMHTHLVNRGTLETI